MARGFSICFLALAILVSRLSSVKSEILTSSADISQEYDFVIVGGGTAGNVIANRLTEDPSIQVLVIEAGGINEGLIDAEVPFFWTNLAGSAFDWNFTTTSQTGLGGRSITYPRGYVLGGTSTINGMTYTRGSSEVYDKIAQLTGDNGWSWNSVQPYIRKNEKWSHPADNHDTTGQYDPSVHSLNGITAVSLPTFPRPIDERVLQTTQENSEFPFNLDINSGNQLGVGWLQSTITSQSRRDSSATSYLASQFISRPNLHVLLHNQVTRLLPSNGHGRTPTFNAVQFVQRIDGVLGPNKTVTAKKEIILSGGTVGTPHILLHSGIGDRDALSACGISSTHHLPAVGKNLTDHASAINIWSVNSTDTFETVTRNSTLVAQYLDQWRSNGTGYFADTVNNHIGFLRLPGNASIFQTVADPAAGPNTPHIEFIVTNGLPVTTPPPTGNFLVVATFLLTPLSRGSIALNSSNPFDQPLIDLGLLTQDFDRFTLRESIRTAQRFLDSPAWSGYILGPFGGLSSVDLQDDDQIDEYLRANAASGSHAVGTAAMSPQGASWGVTDPDLKVKGVNGIRIVDASVIPTMPSGHTQAPVYIVAERAADIIKQAWNLSS